MNCDKGDKNFWIVELLPFDKKNNEKKSVAQYQKECKETGVFSMGWIDFAKYLKNKNNNLFGGALETYIKDIEIFILKNYKILCEDFGSDRFGVQIKLNSNENGLDGRKGFIKALRRYSEIKEGDIILTRLSYLEEEPGYYTGEVSEVPCYLPELINNEIITKFSSWGGKVTEWKRIGKGSGDDPSVHGAIRGLFSSGYSQTIDKIPKQKDDSLDIVQKILRWELITDEEREYFEKPKITKTNFNLYLSPYELEDLVAFYIQKRLKDEELSYSLIPSTCKQSSKDYEFVLVNKRIPTKKISCQVKNKEDINPENFKNSQYERVYLFSGLTNWCGHLEDDYIYNLKDPMIVLVHRKNLFDTMVCEENKAYFKEILGGLLNF